MSKHKKSVAPRLKLSVSASELAKLPPPIAALYGEGREITGRKELWHHLDVDPNTLPDRASVKQRQDQQDARTSLQIATAKRIAARCGIKPESMSDALAAIAEQIRIETDAHGANVAVFQDGSSGLTLRSGDPGSTAPVGEDEFVQRYFRPDESWLHPKAAESQLDEPEVFRSKVDRRDVALTETQASDHRLYMEARQLADERGSELIVVPDAPNPERQFQSGQGDVPITQEQAADHATYVRAKEQAAKKGGSLVIVDDPNSSPSTLRAAYDAVSDRTARDLKPVADAADLVAAPRRWEGRDE